MLGKFQADFFARIIYGGCVCVCVRERDGEREKRETRENPSMCLSSLFALA